MSVANCQWTLFAISKQSAHASLKLRTTKMFFVFMLLFTINSNEKAPTILLFFNSLTSYLKWIFQN